MCAPIISTTEARSPAEGNLDAIIENFDGVVWSIDRDLQCIVLNTALREKTKELVGAWKGMQPDSDFPDGVNKVGRQDKGTVHLRQVM